MKARTVLLLNCSTYVERDFRNLKKFIYRFFKFKFLLKDRNVNLQFGFQRIKQYEKGLKQLQSLKIFELFDQIIFTDNTVPNKYFLPPSFKKILPTQTKYILRRKNKYKNIGKGAGMIENLKYCINSISDVDFIYYFEPRLILINKNSILDFVNNPCNVFKEDSEYYKSGYFGVNYIDLINFLNKLNFDELITAQSTAEKLIYEYFKNLKPKILDSSITLRNYGFENKMSIHDEKAYHKY